MLKMASGFFRAGRVFGIEVRITYLLLIFVGLMALSEVGHGIEISLITIIMYALLALFVFLHEMGHSLAAMKEGMLVRAIYLHPLGGLAQLEGHIPGPGAEIVIALAGPFVSFLLAGVFYVPMTLFTGGVAYYIFLGLFKINLMLGLFNLLPVFPLDGGRVLTAALVMKLGFERGVRVSIKVAKVGLIILGLVGLGMMLMNNIYGIQFIIIAVLLYFLGAQEMQARNYASQYASYGMYGGYQDSYSQGSYSYTAYDSKTDGKEKKKGWFARKMEERTERRDSKKRERDRERAEKIDDILRKVRQEGIANLSASEKKLLEEESKRIKGDS